MGRESTYLIGPRQVKQSNLFYESLLDTHVYADDLLRAIDHFVDLTGLHPELAPFHASTGRPSVDPELMIIGLPQPLRT